jgi:hypothetical protein
MLRSAIARANIMAAPIELGSPREDDAEEEVKQDSEDDSDLEFEDVLSPATMKYLKKRAYAKDNGLKLEEINDNNNDDKDGDTHMSPSRRRWRSFRAELAKTRADAITDSNEAPLPLGSSHEDDVEEHNPKDDLKSNLNDISKNNSKDNSNKNDTNMAGFDIGDDAPRKRKVFHAPLGKDSANMMTVSNMFPPPSEDGDEGDANDSDGSYHHPKRHIRISKS